MPRTSTPYPTLGILSVILVVAISVIAAIVITAWLVHQVARRAIDKVAPEQVAPVILALAAWLDSIRLFLPWSCRAERTRSPGNVRDLPQTPLQNEVSSELLEEGRHET